MRRGHPLTMNYIHNLPIDKLENRMRDGAWWFIHLAKEELFWEAWGKGWDVNSFIRSGKRGGMGVLENDTWEGVITRGKEKMQRGYNFVENAVLPVKTQMMPGGYARTTISENGTYGVNFEIIEKGVKTSKVSDEVPALVPRTRGRRNKETAWEPRPKTKEELAEEARIEANRKKRLKDEEERQRMEEEKKKKEAEAKRLQEERRRRDEELQKQLELERKAEAERRRKMAEEQKQRKLQRMKDLMREREEESEW